MAYSEKLALQIAEILLEKDIFFTEKKMFGGLAFMIEERMALGVVKDSLMIRCTVDEHEKLLESETCREMDFTGKPMRGFLFIDEPFYDTEKKLKNWVETALDFIQNSIPKKKKSK